MFSDENLSNFRNSLQYTNWEPILNIDDANDSYELFQSTLLSIFNDHFPLQTKNVYNKADRKPWISPEILTSISANRRLEKKSNPGRYLTIYLRDKNLLTKVTRTTRDQYYRTLLETSIGNSKKIWSNINCILGDKHSSINTCRHWRCWAWNNCRCVQFLF